MTEKKRQEIPMNFKVDDFFTNQKQRDGELLEKTELIDISLIDNFTKHPFKIIENDELQNLKESIASNGVITPAIVRKKDNGRYEMISGHRRKHVCSSLGIKKLPCKIVDLTDDEAVIAMVDSNIQRQTILPSEKAFAYKMKYDALKRQGRRTDLTSGPVDQKLTAEKIGKEANESEKTIRRYIRLTYLIPELLKLVDNSETKTSPSIALRPAVALSYLTKDEQIYIATYIKKNLITPSVEQAQNLKDLSEEGKLTVSKIMNIMEKEKPNQKPKFRISEENLFNVLPSNIKRENIEDFILKACSYYTKHLKQKDRER